MSENAYGILTSLICEIGSLSRKAQAKPYFIWVSAIQPNTTHVTKTYLVFLYTLYSALCQLTETV